MRTLSAFVSAALLCATVPCFGLSPTHHKSSTHASIRHSSVRSHHRHSSHHQAIPAMDPARATQIQTALIKSGYLKGEPTGTWDAQSSAAMQKLQGDNGWQTKITPDSRALIKLGLGPQRDYQTASNTMPQ